MLVVEIVVQGRIDQNWCDLLGGLVVSDRGTDRSMVSGFVQDQAAAFGIIARMRDFGFHIYSVRIEIIQKDDEQHRLG
jgi:hypothetical protein